MRKKPGVKSKSNNLKPDYTAKDISDVDFNYLRDNGVKALLIDLDHTLVAYKSLDVDSWVKEVLKNQPLPYYIATNRPVAIDLKHLQQDLGAEGLIQPETWKMKPFASYYKRAVGLTGYKPSELIMIGDRFIQDIYGANKAGLQTLVVEKMGGITPFDFLLSRIEKYMVKNLNKNYEPIE